MNDPTASTSLDDFLNLDLVAATGGLDTNPSSTATSTDFHDLFSPRLSDASPSSAATFLPPNTPPQPMQSQTAMDTLNPNHVVFGDLYNTYIEPLRRGYFSKPSTSSSSGAGNLADGAFAFNDLFASYSNDGTFNLFPPASSSDSTATASTAPLALPFTIDPQLVATPAPSHASPLLSTDNEAVPASNHKSSPAATSAPVAPPKSPAKSNSFPRASTDSVIDEDSEDDDEDEDDDDMPVSPASAKARAKAKKGVATGGVTKRTQVTSCVVREADSNDPEDWRPTAEEYKKLSSKEKRQLRNKISARNFRVRRKEYITTLEGQISDRDKLISAIREELGAQKMENAELREEIDSLKKAMLEGRAPLPTGLPPPSATSSISPGPSRRSAPLTKANPNKDVGGSGSFWGGAIGMGGVTSVHTMVVPEFPVMANVLAGKGPRNWGLPLSTATLGTLPGHGARLPQDNINPNMNPRTTGSPVSSSTSGSSSEGESPSSGSSSESPISTPPQSPPLNLISNNTNLQQPWSGVSDINPFTIKTLDSYRMQLWSKMAAAGHVPQQPLQQQQALFNTYSASVAGGTSSLANQLRPAFFDTPDSSSASASGSKKPSSSLSALLAGKTASNLAASSHYPTPPTSPNAKPATLPSGSSASSAQQAQQYAAAASLVSRMSSAFSNAFAQPSASSSSTASTSASAAKAWDMEKVRKVLEGKAVLKVVDVDQLQPPAAPSATVATSSALKKSPLLRAKSVDPGLEEKMSRLSLNMTTGLSREDREVDSSLTPLAHPSAMKPSAFKTLLK